MPDRPDLDALERDVHAHPGQAPHGPPERRWNGWDAACMAVVIGAAVWFGLVAVAAISRSL